MGLINVFTGSSTRTLRSPPRKAIWLVSRVWSWASLAEADQVFQIVSCWVKGIQKEDQCLSPPLSPVDEEEREGKRKAILYQHQKEKKIAREKVRVLGCVYARNLLCISMRRTRKCSYVTHPLCTHQSLSFSLFFVRKGSPHISYYEGARRLDLGRHIHSKFRCSPLPESTPCLPPKPPSFILSLIHI